MGQCLPTSIRRDQGVSHTPSHSGSSVLGKPFLFYVRAMNHSLGALLAQTNDQNHEQAIYYLSRIMIEAEYHFNPFEKECLAVISSI